MPLLLSCQAVSKTFAAKPLFENISFGISDSECIGLVGPNGSGKSTLLRIVAGRIDADGGNVAARKLLRLGYVPQQWEQRTDVTVQDLVDAVDVPDREAKEREILGRTGFYDTTALVSTLSGGWKKRLAIALELLKSPDLLIMDEPTNHLDLEGILWLEKMLQGASYSSLIVSHDRYFLENISTRMMEINKVYPDGLFSVNGNYSEFLVKKDEFLHAQSKYQESLENRVRREIEWLRRGPKARTTKSKARIDSAGRMIEELSDVNTRTAQRSTNIDFSGTERKTKRLIEGDKVQKSLGGKPLFRELSFVVSPGTRLGLLGPNGSGKSTLLRLITGEMEPDAGEMKRADRVRIVYFDQNREQLDPTIPLRKALAPEGDSVIFRDRTIHVASWAARFMFRSDQLDLAVGRLSGGEQARVAIARLMLQPADVLLLDEPTNDLDIPTLEVLEESLLDFPGGLVLVSHDRYLLDRVSTHILGLDGNGNAGLYASCEQWEQDLARQRAEVKKPKQAVSSDKPASKSTARKLSYLETRELEGIEDAIGQAEEKLTAAEQEMQNPVGASDAATMHARYEALTAAQGEVERLYARWSELEAKLAG
jgi:ATP-binding cassette subfamily F protein uup